MPSDEFKHEFMRLVIRRVRGVEDGFGKPKDRPQSYYAYLQNELGPAEGRKRFREFAWGKTVQLKIIPCVFDDAEAEVDVSEADAMFAECFPDDIPQQLSNDQYGRKLRQAVARILLRTGLYDQGLPEENEQSMRAVVNYADLYGHWVKDLKRGQCPTELRGEIETWARRRLPSECAGHTDLRALVDRLLDYLACEISGYEFDIDLRTWAIPKLAQAMLDALQACEHQTCRHRQEINQSEWRPRLRGWANTIADHIRTDFGIYGIDGDEMAERALWALIGATKDEFAHRCQQCRELWAKQELKAQFKLFVPYYWQPRMEMVWGLYGEDDCEKKKRDVLISTYSDAAHGVPCDPGGSAAPVAAADPQPDPDEKSDGDESEAGVLDESPEAGERGKPSLDELLDAKEREMLRLLRGAGYSLSAVVKDIRSIKERIREQLLGRAIPTKKLRVLVSDLFCKHVVELGYNLPAAAVSNCLSVGLTLNRKQAAILWLGLFYDWSVDPEGLWRLLIEHRTIGLGSPVALPQVVDNVFDQPLGCEGELEDYLDKVYRRADAALNGLGDELAGDTPKLIAWIIGTRLEGYSPAVVVQRLKALTRDVHNNLRRGYNMLEARLVMRVCQVIDHV